MTLSQLFATAGSRGAEDAVREPFGSLECLPDSQSTGAYGQLT